ncbi:hypothetical protein ES708_24321 [subsurface metagenome]
MTHKYERQCWSCGSKNMERFTDHVKCRDCGATWNAVPTMGIPPIVEVSGKAEMGSSFDSASRFRPHGALARSRARKRDQKVQPGIER